MPTGLATPRDFKREIPLRPENALFFPDRTLLRVAENDADEFSIAVRAEALVELAVRYHLSRNDRFRPVLENGIGSGRLRDFLMRCTLAAGGNAMADDLRRSLGGCPDDAVADALCARFARLLAADGVIPVFNPADGEAWLLPFSFADEVAPGNDPVVSDLTGNRIAVWSTAMGDLPEPVGRNIRVGIALTPSLQALPSGSSLLLPVLAAWWRKESRIPRYDPFRLVFTGSFRAGTLACVETDEKERKMAAIKDGMLFRPSAAGRPRTKTSLPEGSSVDAVFNAVRELAEEETDSSLAYAQKRIRDFETDVRQNRFAGWPSVLRRLERIGAGLNKAQTPKAWLDGVLLRAAANCHAGNTSEAARLNAEAVAFCDGKPRFETELLRALVEQLVVLQDCEDFDRLFALAPGLGGRIDDYVRRNPDSETATDLRMRFHGTMGQFHAYACLAGVRTDEASPVTAKNHFDEALAAAQTLCEAATEDELAVRAADVAQDSNYQVLWRALFDPTGLPGAFSDAAACTCNGSLSPGAARKNDLFAHRFTALGLYLCILKGEPVPVVPGTDFRDALSAPDEGGWIAGTTAKYLGAVAAARGDEAESARLFGIATAAIDADAKEIIGVIRMTIHAEAFRSLRRFPVLAARAEECRREALRFLRSGDPAAETKSSWRAWLDNPDAVPFPGLSYWY